MSFFETICGPPIDVPVDGYVNWSSFDQIFVASILLSLAARNRNHQSTDPSTDSIGPVDGSVDCPMQFSTLKLLCKLLLPPRPHIALGLPIFIDYA